MSKHFYRNALLVWVAQVVSLGQSPGLGGMIRGSVILDSSGKGVPAATVMLAQIAAPTQRRIEPQIFYSGKDGSFFFSRLPPGKYQVCARLSQSNLLVSPFPTARERPWQHRLAPLFHSGLTDL